MGKARKEARAVANAVLNSGPAPSSNAGIHHANRALTHGELSAQWLQRGPPRPPPGMFMYHGPPPHMMHMPPPHLMPPGFFPPPGFMPPYGPPPPRMHGPPQHGPPQHGPPQHGPPPGYGPVFHHISTPPPYGTPPPAGPPPAATPPAPAPAYAAAPMMEEAASAEADAAPPPPADVADVDALWAHLMAAAFADGRTGEELGEPYAGVELVRHEPIALDPSRASRQPVGPSGISFSVAAPSQQQFISLRLLSHDEAMHARIIDAKIHPPEVTDAILRAQSFGAQFSARNSLRAILTAIRLLCRSRRSASRTRATSRTRPITRSR